VCVVSEIAEFACRLPENRLAHERAEVPAEEDEVAESLMNTHRDSTSYEKVRALEYETLMFIFEFNRAFNLFPFRAFNLPRPSLPLHLLHAS